MSRGLSDEEVVANAIQNMDFSLERREAWKQDIQAERAAAGATPVSLGPAPSTPDVPVCDACGKDWSGHLACSRCKAAFYCSKECQKEAWKNGHKKQCESMFEECKATGQAIVGNMMDTTLEPFERTNDDLSKLDPCGFYKAAVAAGLHQAIVQLFREDQKELLQRYASTNAFPISFTHWMVVTLFRGQRVEGQGLSSGNFRYIDGQRCSSFVKHDPQAFDAWLDASFEMIRTMINPRVIKNKRNHLEAQTAARNIWAAWGMVFANDRASKAILLMGGSQPSDETVLLRCKSIAARFKKLMPVIHNADKGDPRSIVDGHFHQVAAMIAYRIREYEIPIDFEKLLALKGTHKQIYKKMAVPLAEGMIAKGYALTTPETQIAIQRASRR